MTPPPDPHERFMRLFVQHEPEILGSVLLIVPSRADARDIVQETAVALWQHFDQYDPSRPFANWAIGFARIQIRRFLRSVQRRAVLSEKAAEIIMLTEDKHSALIEKRTQALGSCLETLPENQRSLIEGYYFDEKAIAALASQHNRSTEAVYKSIQRIRLLLQTCINSKLTGVSA